MRLLILLFSFLFAFNVSGQSNDARQIDDIQFGSCDALDVRMNSVFSEYKDSQDSKIYVIYYEELNHLASANGSKGKKLVNPRRGNALNRAKEIPLYLKTVYKVPKDRIILIDGGFRKDLELEIWLVPKFANPPKPSPTIAKKDVKFEKGKPLKVRNCASAYE